MGTPQTNIMIDLESLGNVPYNGVIIALGAVAFRMDEEVTYPVEHDFECSAGISKFFYPIRIVEQVQDHGFVIETDTLRWWLETPEKTAQLNAFLSSDYRTHIRDVFEKFAWWIASIIKDPKDILLWSHGVTYDCLHLQQKWDKVMQTSFNRICPFRQMRDTRTLFDAYGRKFSDKSPYPEWVPQRKHHPLEDSYVQAIAVQTAMRGLVHGE